LLTAWKIVCAACAILLFRASPLGRRVLAAHVFEGLKRGDEAPIFKLIFWYRVSETKNVYNASSERGLASGN
jgi:hypothetical protein